MCLSVLFFVSLLSALVGGTYDHPAFRSVERLGSSLVSSTYSVVFRAHARREREKRSQREDFRRIGALLGDLALPGGDDGEMGGASVESELKAEELLKFSDPVFEKAFMERVIQLGQSLHHFALPGEGAPLCGFQVEGVETGQPGEEPGRPVPVLLKTEEHVVLQQVSSDVSARATKPKGVVVYSQFPSISSSSEEGATGNHLLLFKAESKCGKRLDPVDLEAFFSLVARGGVTPEPAAPAPSAWRRKKVETVEQPPVEETWPSKVSVFIPQSISSYSKYYPSMEKVVDLISNLHLSNSPLLEGFRNAGLVYGLVGAASDIQGDQVVSFQLGHQR